MFVGRERELAYLRAAFQDASSGHRSLVLIGGEPGVGKTSLADEAARQGRGEGARIFWGRCHQEGGAPGYWPWLQILRAYARECDGETLAEEIGADAVELARILPELRGKLPGLADKAPSSPDDREDTRFYLFDSIVTLLRSASARAPLVLILDDLDSADPSSLLLLRFLAPELRDSRILVMGTYRDAGTKHDPAVGRALASLAGDSRRLTLTGLAESEIASLVRNSADSPASDLAAALWQSTEGNPFFAKEVLELLSSQGRLSERDAILPGTFAVPENVSEAIRSRLAYLPDDAREVLSVASVVGREFGLGVVGEVCRSGGGDLPAAVEEARGAGLIREIAGEPGHYRFAQSLTRETIYRDLSPARRSELHRQIGEAIERLYGARDDHVVELAHHFGQVVGNEAADKAFRYACRAGRNAFDVLAFGEAALQYRSAVRILRRYDRPSSERTQLGELLLALANAHRKAGDHAAAKSAFLDAAQEMRAMGDLRRFADAALGYAGDLELFGYRIIGGTDETVVGLLNEALAGLPPDEASVRSRLLGRLALALYWSAPVERRRALCREATEVAEETHDPAIVTAALSTWCRALWGPDTIAERAEVFARILDLDEGRNRDTALSVRRWRINDLLELGDAPAIDREIDAYARLAEQLRGPELRVNALTLRAMRAFMLGHFPEGEKLAAEVFEAAVRINVPLASLQYHVQMAYTWLELGRHEQLETAVAQRRRFAPGIPAAGCSVAFFLSELGNEEGARSELERVAAGDFTDFPRDNTYLPALSYLAETCATLGESQYASALYERLLPYADRNVVLGPPPSLYWGPIAHRLGLLATMLGRKDEAERHFDAALGMSSRMATPSFLAHTSYEHAQMLLGRGLPGDEEKAGDLAARALAIAEHLGMKRLETKLGALKLGGWRSGREPQAKPPISEAVFRKADDLWRIVYGGVVFELKDSAGLGYIAELLRHPGQGVHVLDLVGARGVAAPSAGSAEEEKAVGSPDSELRSEYRSRLEELREELQEASRFNDLGRAEKARENIAALSEKVAEAVGQTRAGGAVIGIERARQSANKAIRSVLQKMTKHNPALAHHLDSSIRTGAVCSYVPDPGRPVRWKLTGLLAYLPQLLADSTELLADLLIV